MNKEQAVKKLIEGWPTARVDAMQVQLFDWARAWVQNETCIEECNSMQLSQSERDAVKLMQIAGVLS